MNIPSWFSLGLTDLTSLQSKEFSRAFSSTTVWKHQFFRAQPSLWSSSHICTTIRKAITLTTRIFVSKVMSLLFNTLFVTAFLLKSKCLLIPWPRMSCCELLAQSLKMAPSLGNLGHHTLAWNQERLHFGLQVCGYRHWLSALSIRLQFLCWFEIH